MVTKPLNFTGKALESHYCTGAPGFARLEIQDASGKPIPDLAPADCPEVSSDEVTRIVA
jgi:hypothetical protein